MIFSLFLEYSNSFIFPYKHLQGQNSLSAVKIPCLPNVFWCSCYSSSLHGLLFRDKICSHKWKVKSISFIYSLFYHHITKCQDGEGAALSADHVTEAAFCHGVTQTLGSPVIQKSPWFIHALRGWALPLSHPDRGECCHDSCSESKDAVKSICDEKRKQSSFLDLTDDAWNSMRGF